MCLFYKQIVIPSECKCLAAACSASGHVYCTAACAASTYMSILQQIVLLSERICPVLPLGVSVLQQPVLPLHMSILQQMVLLSERCPVLPLDVLLFYSMQPVLPLDMSALQLPVLPLDVSIYHLTLFYTRGLGIVVLYVMVSQQHV
jgi:hypothetical protein